MSRAELDLQLVNITSRAEPARYLNEPAQVESSRAEPARYPPLPTTTRKICVLLPLLKASDESSIGENGDDVIIY
jgi:hypothetical protein